MSRLQPCPSCQRHVRAASDTCPFCSVALQPATASARGPSGRRLGRYAAFTFQTGLVAAALGCTNDGLVPGTGGQTGSGGVGTGGLTSSGGGSSSGGASSSGGGSSSGGESALGGEGGLGGETGTGGDDFGVPIYSAVPWLDPGVR